MGVLEEPKNKKTQPKIKLRFFKSERLNRV